MDYLQGSTESANQFMDVGQCNNIGLRETSEKIWWDNHTSSFAMRQIAMFEQELGWAFWTNSHLIVVGAGMQALFLCAHFQSRYLK